MFNGEMVREIRQKKKYTLKQLAERTGLSTSLLSQIERGLVDPTVGTFWKICSALHTPIEEFFFKGGSDFRVVRKDEREVVEISDANVRYHFLRPMQQGKLDFLLVEIDPGQLFEKELVSHPGEEAGFVMQGELQVKLGGSVIHLYEGDSIYFSSMTPHRYINPGTCVSLSVWTVAR